jgi:hypothetical protein
MRAIKTTGPHMGMILVFCNYPSIQQRERERDEQRKKLNKKGTQ